MERNIAGLLSLKFGATASQVAAGAGDNTEVDGTGIDRQGAMSAAICVVARSVLQATETNTIKMTIQESSDNSNWTDIAAALQPEGAANSTILTQLGGSGGTTEEDVYKLALDLSSLKRYIRVQILPDLSASGTDTAVVAAAVVLGGLDVAPDTVSQ